MAALTTRLCKRVCTVMPPSIILQRALTERSVYEKTTNTHKAGHYHLISLFEPSRSPAISFQQIAGKKRNDKKRQVDINKPVKITHNDLKDIVDLNVINGRMQNELMELQQTYFTINVKSNPSVLASVYIRVGVELCAVTDICNIVNEPGKVLVLDCSLYSEQIDNVLEAVNKETAFVATPHGKNSLKLMSPKVTSELRTRLARQAKDQMNLRIANGKKTLNDSIRLVDDSKTDVNTKHRTKTNLVEIYNHFRKKAEVMHKEKEGSLKDDFDL